ncbi:MAG: hypothetical protein P857_315 [Candidatus Xenolissoclinum pacificiensis L6]|uniref:Xaa-Pro dipeptidyl-peptidase-like domain-containing protein n=1 Tax=Candidatus Xenolissoclinum pacificiensis L6 TaxID=1401685 RepID=W2UZW1_9RICK|nr:MAG: hypothetical protein P857_315 [Candidatus Xenolissoclinum pacificiensis L6]
MFNILIPGLAGKLEVKYVRNNDDRCALILPPHPNQPQQYPKMNFDIRIVECMENAFHKSGFSTLRVIYRGTGKSEGNITDAPEEILRDTNKAINWLENNIPLVQELWISGYSYGAWLSLNMLMRRPEITGFVIVGLPTTNNYDYSFVSPYHDGGLIIQSTQDPLSPNISEVQNIVQNLSASSISQRDLIDYTQIESNYYDFTHPDEFLKIENRIFQHLNDKLNSTKTTEHHSYQETT